MDPISSQPPPYTQFDIDLYALQKQHRHTIQVQVDVQLPKPFGLVDDKKAKKAEKGKKESKDKEGKQKPSK